MPLVTVVIPAYNSARFIRDALESALAQTYGDLEVVVVDDGSTDETASVVRAFSDGRVNLLCTPNRGVGAARNRGWREGCGEFVAFLDADDRWDTDKLAAQMAVLLSEPEVGVVGSLMRYESVSGRALGITGTADLTGPNLTRLRLGKLMPFPISSVVVRRAILEALGGFDEELAKFFRGLVEDIDFLARAACISEVKCVPRVLGTYRVHGTSASARHFASQRQGVRFVRARLAKRGAGGDLDPAEFLTSNRLSVRQRWGDVVAWSYRRAGLAVAERRWPAAILHGMIALVLGPRYTLTRVARQRVLRVAIKHHGTD